MTHEQARAGEVAAPAAPVSRSLHEAAPGPTGLIAGAGYGSFRLAPTALMGLQACAGNAAVASVVLQRTLTLQRDPVTNDAEFRAAVGRSDWAPAVAYLAGLPLAAIEKLASGLNLGPCESLLGKVTAEQHSVRGALLERGFALTKGTDWVKAARFVSVLDDAGIARNVAALKPPELKLLAKGARNSLAAEISGFWTRSAGCSRLSQASCSARSWLPWRPRTALTRASRCRRTSRTRAW